MHRPERRQPKTRAPGADATVQKGIPAQRGQRERVLMLIREYVAARRLVPPLSLAELQEHSGRVLQLAELDETHRDFVSVLLSNEAWRPTVAKIPFDKRLLLLPQCLRDPVNCQADLDEYGLVCAQCGSCCIGELQAEAERLGYATLVAEGSPVVMGLIESGQVQAILGVSCLSVLERVFPYMEAGAVPGLAVPLLRDGCAETLAELDWVWDALYMSSEDQYPRMDLEALRREVDTWFTPAALDELLGVPDSQTPEIARDWLARAGKRWRPFLTACTFQAIQDDPDTGLGDDLRRLGVAVECFHKASLVHDDIEDDDECRYGQQALHEQYGVAIALNVGDYLLGLGYRLIAEIAAPADACTRMLRVAAEGHLSLCQGQGQELRWSRRPGALAVKDVLEIFQRKTAPSFEVALKLGALAAGADGDVWPVLREYSHALGIAYQIRDDIEDYLVGEDRGDVFAARPNVLMALAYQEARDPDRAFLERIWREPAAAPELADELEAVLRRLRAEPLAQELLAEQKYRAVRCLSAMPSADLKGLLRRVVSRIFQDVQLMGCCDDHQAEHARRRRSGRGDAG